MTSRAERRGSKLCQEMNRGTSSQTDQETTTVPGHLNLEHLIQQPSALQIHSSSEVYAEFFNDEPLQDETTFH